MKIAILGGTFNPIHNGHLALANTALETLFLDKVLFMPCYIPPHKDINEVVSADDRLSMIEYAIAGNAKLEASRLEINRRNVSYSVETVSFMKKIYPKNTELFFLAGSDSVKTLEAWKNIDKMLSMCKFVVGVRPGNTVDIKNTHIAIMPMAPVEISSSKIRKTIKDGKSIKGFVPQEVANYIKQANLYI